MKIIADFFWKIIRLEFSFKLTWTWRLTKLTPLIALVAMITLGGGHGTPVPTYILYPKLFLFHGFENSNHMWVWVLLLGQYPMYGFIIDLAALRSRQLLAAGILTIIHFTLVVLAATDMRF